jgi:predicted MFS family arabinose efflux permease
MADEPADESTVIHFSRRPSILDGIKIALEKEVALLLLFGTLSFCSSMTVLSTLTILLERSYGLNPLQVGLCYLPYGCGVISVRWTAGRLVDRNFQRLALQAGVEVAHNQQTRLEEVPLEKARLQFTLFFAYMSCIFITLYAWLMEREVHVAGPLIALFFVGNASGGVNSTLSTLLVDLHTKRPATIMSSLNLFRFICGAGFVAAAMPLVDVIGIGWMGFMVALLMILASPSLWIVLLKGHQWRRDKTLSVDRA